jgi:hypothetical protein
MKKANLRIRSTAGVLALATAVLTLALTACDDGGGGGGNDSVYITIAGAAQLNAAMNQIKSGGNGKNYILTIAGTVPVPASDGSVPTFGSAGNLTVTLNGNGAMFFLSGTSASTRQTLVIDGPTLQGKAGNNLPLVGVFGTATLEMKSGKISGNTGTGTPGGGVSVENGSFAMSDGKISGNNSSDSGGGVYVQGGSFTITGGVISGNTAPSGGGVYINNYTTTSFVKSGGTIYGDDTAATDNTATTGNGHAVYYYKDISNKYYCDDTLAADASGNISTNDTLPIGSTPVGNWTKE